MIAMMPMGYPSAAAMLPSKPIADLPVSMKVPPNIVKGQGLLVDGVPCEVTDERQLIPLAAIGLNSGNHPQGYKDQEENQSQTENHQPTDPLHVNHVENHAQQETQNSNDDADGEL